MNAPSDNLTVVHSTVFTQVNSILVPGTLPELTVCAKTNCGQSQFPGFRYFQFAIFTGGLGNPAIYISLDIPLPGFLINRVSRRPDIYPGLIHPWQLSEIL